MAVQRPITAGRGPAQPVPANPLTRSLADVIPADATGALAELIGSWVHIYGVEMFTSTTYASKGCRITLKVADDAGYEVGDESVYTAFAWRVVKMAETLCGADGYAAINPPIRCKVIQQGPGYTLVDA